MAQMAVWLGPGARELSSGKEASRGSSVSRGGFILASGYLSFFIPFLFCSFAVGFETENLN